MKTIHVSLKTNAYKIIIGNKILSKFGPALKKLNIGREAIIVTNPLINQHYGKSLARGLARNGFHVKTFEVPDGEKSKSAKVAMDLLEKVAQYDVMKKAFIIALGGGVIGDLAGFVAAVYKRGVPYIQVPTTLLAQIDSAIGGKVAIDLAVGKNLVGAFYQPQMVYSDVDVLTTLSKRQIRNGLAEAVKYGVIYDRKLFDYLAKHYEGLINRQPHRLMDVVVRCSRIKTKVVINDEKETKGIRTILNFGHTIGHAIEAAGRYSLYHHGEAIALGMRVAADISREMGMLSQKNVSVLNELLSQIGLPEHIKKVRLTDILRIMKHDKKFLANKNRFVLAKSIGKVRVVEGVPLPVIRRAVQKFMAN